MMGFLVAVVVVAVALITLDPKRPRETDREKLERRAREKRAKALRETNRWIDAAYERHDVWWN